MMNRHTHTMTEPIGPLETKGRSARQPMACRPRASSLRHAIGLALAAIGAHAAAQGNSPESPAAPPTASQEATALETITVTGARTDAYTEKESAAATKLNLSPRETPQSVTVITRERLDDQNLDSLRSVLDNTPGVYSNAYDTERVLFYARGFPIDALMYDGVPAVSSFTTGSVDETIDMLLYERIEVVRGATGLMTGAGSPAASINLVRKHANAKTVTASFDLSVGSWRNRRAEADVTLPLNADASVRARFAAAVEDTESYQALYQKKKYVAYGIVDADLSHSTTVSLGFDHQDNRPRSNTWGSFPIYLGDGSLANWPNTITTSTDWAYWNRKTQTVFAELRQTFGNGWSLRSTLSHRQFKEDLELFYVFGYPDPVTGAGLRPYASKSKGKVTETSLDVHASGPFELFGRRHELVAGYNGSRAKKTGTEYAPPDPMLPIDNFFEWDGSYPRPAFDTEGFVESDIDADQDGVYLVGRFNLADRLKLIAGARYATWKIDSYYVYDDPPESRYDYRKLIPYAGLVWDLSASISAFTSYTGIFKPQNNRDANGHYLDPVDGQSFEVGLKGEHLNRRLNTSLTLFQTRQNNLAVPVIDPETDEQMRRPDGTPISAAIDGTRTRGFEFEATGRLNEEWQGSLGWTRNLSKDGDGQAVRTDIPSTLLRLYATWEPRRWIEGLRLGAGVNWQSASRTLVGSPDGMTPLRQPSVTQVSMMARYQLAPNAAVQFNVNNVFDRSFYVLDEYDNTYYGAPRNYSLSLNLSY